MKNTKESIAQLLNGRSMGHEIEATEEVFIKASGLVVAFGYSDDCVELRGAISDEVSAYDGTTFHVTKEGVAPIWREGEQKTFKEAVKYFANNKLPGADIEAVWGPKNLSLNLSWAFNTELPHATFDILEDGEPFCRGIVFSLEDLPK